MKQNKVFHVELMSVTFQSRVSFRNGLLSLSQINKTGESMKKIN